MAAPVAMPLADICGGMTAVDGNDATSVPYSVSITIASGSARSTSRCCSRREDRRPAMQRNASDAHPQILGHIGVHLALPIPFFSSEVCALRGLAPGLARGSQRRNPAVRWIHDQRSAIVRPHAVLPRLEPVGFEVVIGGGRIVLGVAAADVPSKESFTPALTAWFPCPSGTPGSHTWRGAQWAYSWAVQYPCRSGWPSGVGASPGRFFTGRRLDVGFH